MLELEGYTIVEQLSGGHKTTTWRARRDADGKPVAIKVASSEHPPRGVLACLKHDYEVGSRFEDPRIVEMYALERAPNGFALVMEDFGGRSLQHWMQNRDLDVAAYLRIAIAVAEAIGAVHERSVVHKDVKPSNLIVNDDASVVKLSDFGISTVLARERTPSFSPDQLEGSLLYIAPEQTGRMNRTVDYRSDFYSLGATLYELFCGRPPFLTEDPMELVYSHIAQQPTPPCEINADVPANVSRLILKLMSKMAEERYQSVFGLIADLKRCLAAAEQGDDAADLELGGDDVSARFAVPERLYGRDVQLSELMGCFDRVAAGARETMLVSGYSGIGKSALIGEISRPVTAERGYFIRGKFDQFNRDIPYSAFTQAFAEMARKILTEPERRVADWKQRILVALEELGREITDVVPEMALVIGPQAELPALGAIEAKARFYLAFRRFVSAFANEEHPLVIFLDDLQWADQGSLNLIRLLMCDEELSHLLFIGAYRDNEVDAAHPLADALAEMRQGGAIVQRIELGPLDPRNVNGLVAETMGVPPASAQQLSELVYAKTRGNPFFVKEFLGTLHAKGLIAFGRDAGVWTWDTATIEREGITENVVELMAARIETLDQASRRVLRLAACMGNQFDLQRLALVAELSPEQVAEELTGSLEGELLQPVGPAYKYSEWIASKALDDEAGAPGITYRFRHDRVQQAAYELISEDERRVLHQRIGQLILRESSEGQVDEQIFEIVNHLNMAASTLVEPQERFGLAALNLKAGSKAKASTAYETAIRHLEVADQLLADDGWSAQPELTRDVHLALAESAHLASRDELMERVIDRALSQVTSLLDRVRLFEVRLQCYANRMKYRETVDTGLEVLRMLGVRFPKKQSKLHVVAGVVATKAKIGRRQPEDFLDLPEMDDPELLATMRIMGVLCAASYFVAPNLMPLLIFKLVQLSIKHGVTGVSCFGFSAYGLVLSAHLGDFDGGYRYGVLGQKLVDRIGAEAFRCRCIFLGTTFTGVWMLPFREVAKLQMEGVQAGLSTGDLEYYSYINCNAAWYDLLSGEPLELVSERAHRAAAANRQQNLAKGMHIANFVATTADLLRGEKEGLETGVDDPDEQALVREWQRVGEPNTLSHCAAARTERHFFGGRFEQAVEADRIVEENLEAIWGQGQLVTSRFYGTLARLQLGIDAKHVAASLKTWKSWAANLPANFSAFATLLVAEQARVKADELAAMQGYESAAQLAREHGLIHVEGVAHELAGKFHLGAGRGTLAKSCFGEARRCYMRWGAFAVVKRLDAEVGAPVATGGFTVAGGGGGVRDTTTQDAATALDLDAVTRAARAISSEIQVERLIERVMRLAAENAGAERGVLLVEESGELIIRARSVTETAEIALCSEPMTADIPFSRSIVNYAVRTGEAVVLTDARAEELFANDDYVVAEQPRSVLCIPLVNQGKTRGVVYLENNLTPGAFTTARVEVIRIMAGQAAIALENARLYAAQDALISSQQRFLPSQFLEILGHDSILDVEIGDHVERQMTVLFSDVRGFTSISESLTPEESMSFINSYLGSMEKVITEHGGFVDNYIGDAIMALFPGSPDDAVRAAIAMQSELARVNADRSRDGQQPIRIGIGINTGELMLGTIGGEGRLRCSVIGDNVNLASRIEGLTRAYGANVLISADTHSGLANPTRYSVRAIDRVAVKGRSEPLTIYEVLDAEPADERDRKVSSSDALDAARAAYVEARFGEALAGFRECLERCPSDAVAALFVDRCAALESTGVDDSWDGVHRHTSK